jgi:chromosome segregation ATPase
MADAVTREALGRVDDRAKEGIKNLDRRISLMENRQEEQSRIQAQDARELRDKMDSQARRFDAFTEQQSVLMVAANENKKHISDIWEKIIELSSGLPSMSKAIIKVTDVLDEINLPELKNNQEKLECRFEDAEESRKNYEEAIRSKLDAMQWSIIGGMGAIIIALVVNFFFGG